MTAAQPAPAHSATILDPGDLDDRRRLDQLLARPEIDAIDHVDEQYRTLKQLTPPPEPCLLSEPHRWAYYPWKRAVVSILGPRAFRRVRLDRNRNLITITEQERLGGLRIGVVGLSVGHAIAHCLAAEGLCGEVRLADFDRLELTNLNRVPATVLDLGINKAVVAARRIAELDPYLSVRVLSDGITPESVGIFLDGLDAVVEECDSLDIKVVLRNAARKRRIPVLMATADRGLTDIERFDLEPARPILHGLLGELHPDVLARLSAREKIPHVLRIVDAAQGSARGAASMIELGQTISTWPQLAGDVALGAATIAEVARRIGLGEPMPSGRVRIDVAEALDSLREPEQPPPKTPMDASIFNLPAPATLAEVVAAAAIRAPSGGNSQPWHVDIGADSVSLRLAPERSSTMDVGFRGSAVALGAAVFNARVAAAAHGALGPVELVEHVGGSPLQAVVWLGDGSDANLAHQYEPMLRRETNRHRGVPKQVPSATIEAMTQAAVSEGSRLALLTTSEQIAQAATIIGEADRIRYLTSQLHLEMVSELRWPGDQPSWTGIDVGSLELSPSELATLDILRRRDVRAWVARWGGGRVLADATRALMATSSALAIVSVEGQSLTDYARGGSAVEAVWIAAQSRGLSVHPVSPVFLYVDSRDEFEELSSAFAVDLRRLKGAFRQLSGTAPQESQALVLRLSDSPAASLRSLRRPNRGQ